ncbi:MAG: ABC transporter substrate-binding protein [Ruminococcaceae bacterium]|nr:ABC transporter substrate-binding protein [Oscillospiraceae bacterium]
MKKFVSVISIVLAVFMLMSFAGCAGNTKDDTKTTTAPKGDTGVNATQPIDNDKELPEGEVADVYTLKGPTGMGMAQLIDEEKNSDESDYNFTVVASPEEITAAIINGDADIAACPVNLASVLYNRTDGGVKILALNTLGVTYIVTNGTEVNSIEDLRGKTVITAGQGATPEYILNKLLTDSGLTVGEDVFVEFRTEHADVASLVASGMADVVLLPEPQVTSTLAQNPDLKVALDLTEVWEAKYGTKLVQGCVVARSEFADNYPGTVNDFLEDYKESVDFINTATDEAAQMIVDAGIIPKAPLAKKAIPTSYITFITGDTMKSLVKDNLQVLFDANPKSVGGTLPDENFYYNYIED